MLLSFLRDDAGRPLRIETAKPSGYDSRMTEVVKEAPRPWM